MLEVKNLKKSFGDKKVLKGIDLTINRGDIIGIIGPSGCGKSTFLRCLNLLEKPDSGEVILEGDNLVDNKDLERIRRKIGMVFQQFNLFENMTVLDNITLAPTLLKVMKKGKAEKEADKLLDKVDLKDKKNNYPEELSGGQKQRVAIARSLMMKPEIMLFDEPTSALDPEMIGEVTNLMRQLAKEGMTMVIVSHEINFIKNFCTRVVFMSDGVIQEEGTSEDIFMNPKNSKLKNFLSKINNI
ncbi:MAG: amino acid ABC transporter ATP-binding protein [Bacilli bacterium]|nr:amino acid ABC transporter ATP-binding protein [Bacilli bacterium]